MMVVTLRVRPVERVAMVILRRIRRSSGRAGRRRGGIRRDAGVPTESGEVAGLHWHPREFGGPDHVNRT